MTAAPDFTSDAVGLRTKELFAQQQDAICRRTDRLFLWLLPFQWLAGIAIALWLSPRTWAGDGSSVHPHVWAAVLLGGAITLVPMLLAVMYPGKSRARHAIAIGQTLMSALMIHLSGGRIETHFHVFGSLAFLAVYRDWRVLASASVVVAADHFFRGQYLPQSVFGVLTVSPLRWLEHAGWVVFEDIFLFIAIHQSTREMATLARRQAELEAAHHGVELIVAERTAELTAEITERKRNEETLRLLSSAVEQAKESILITDSALDLPGPEVLFVNPAFTRMTGYTMDEIRGKTPRILQGPRTDKSVLRRLRENLESGEMFAGETINYRKDGTEFTLEWQIAPIRDRSGTITHFTAIQRDISERKQAEAELANAQKDLRAASHAAGMAEVATTVLHNVGNVLNSVNVSVTLATERIRGCATSDLEKVVGLLQQHADDLPAFFANDPRGAQLPAFLASLGEHFTHQQKELLAEMDLLVANVGHIKEIVATQQTYARMAGVVEVLPAETLIEDAIRLNGAALERHGVEIVREYAAGLPPLSIDRHKAIQVLVNLVRNAKYALDELGRADKRLTVRAAAGSDGSVHISVADNGIGIPAENLTRIFEHGFTTRRDGHGFGLHGGALAAKELGGALRVESAGPGCGATFTLELPGSTQSIHS